MQTASLAWHIMSLQMPGSQKFVCRAYPSLSLSYNLIKLYVLLFLFPHCNVFVSPPYHTDIQRHEVTEFSVSPQSVFSFFLAEASSSDAGCHIGYVILVYLRQYPCKKSAPSVPSPRWTGPVIRVNSRCHLCETAASHRWSNKAIKLFSW